MCVNLNHESRLMSVERKQAISITQIGTYSALARSPPNSYIAFEKIIMLFEHNLFKNSFLQILDKVLTEVNFLIWYYNNYS